MDLPIKDGDFPVRYGGFTHSTSLDSLQNLIKIPPDPVVNHRSIGLAIIHRIYVYSIICVCICNVSTRK